VPFVENIGGIDRIVRAVLAIIFLGLAVFSNLPMDIAYFYLALGAILLFNVLLKFSILYSLLDFSTCKKERAIPQQRIIIVLVGMLLLLFALFVLSIDRQSAIDVYSEDVIENQEEIIVAWLASGTLSEEDYNDFSAKCSSVFTEYNNGLITDYAAGARLGKAITKLQEDLGDSFKDINTLTYGEMTREEAKSRFDSFSSRERVFLNQLLLRSRLDGWQIKLSQWYTVHTLGNIKTGVDVNATKEFFDIYQQFESDAEDSA